MSKSGIKKRKQHAVGSLSRQSVPMPRRVDSVKPTASSSKERVWLGGILLLTFLSFSPALFNEFVNWDDYAYIVDNPVIRSLSIENIKYLFNPGTFVVGNYHPLTVLSNAIEYSLFGLNPLMYHLDNIILHLLNTFIIFFVAKRLTANQTMTILITLLFAIHPMRVESVAWAAERKDVLYTLFFLMSTWYYLSYLKGERTSRSYFLSLVLFLCSILSKGQAVVLPLTLILIDFYTNRAREKRMVLDKIPYFALSLIFGLLATQAQHTSLTDQRLATYTLGERFLFACFGILQYLKQLILPVKLSNFYSYPVKTDGSFPIIVYLAPLLVMALVYLIVRFRKNKVVLFGSLYFLSTIFIVLQLLPVGDAITADRYTYIPYIGLFFIASHGMVSLLKNKNTVGIVRYGLGVYFLLLSILTFSRTQDWRNSEILWTDVIEKYPETAIAYNNRAVVKNATDRVDEAITDYQMAIKYNPKYFEAYNNLAGAYGQKGMQQLEMKTYDKAIEVEPGYTTAYFNRGLSYVKYGNYELAIKDYEVVRKSEPANPRVYYSLGIVYKNLGRLDLALKNYSKAIELDPSYIDAYNNRANIYFGQQNYDAAIADYNKALIIQPNAGNTLLNRSAAWYAKKNFTSALQDALKAQDAGASVDKVYLDHLRTSLK